MIDTYFISDSYPMIEDDNTLENENCKTDEITSIENTEEVIQEKIFMPWQMTN